MIYPGGQQLVLLSDETAAQQSVKADEADAQQGYRQRLKRQLKKLTPARSAELEFELLNRGQTGRPVIFSGGFLSEGEDDSRWHHLLQKAFPDSEILLLQWRSSNSKHALGWGVKTAAQSSLGFNTVAHALGAVVPAVGVPLRVAGAALTARELANNPWIQARNEAEAIGNRLAELLNTDEIRADQNQPFILIGYSLGAKLMLQALSRLQNPKQVVDSYLLAAAIDIDDERWALACQKLSGRIHNFFSRQDAVLKYAYRAGNLSRSSAAGRKPVNSEAVFNHDLTDLIDGHFAYAENAADQVVELLRQQSELSASLVD